MFEKSEDDRKFYHRDAELNNFYKGLIDFKNGDEVLQIGKVSLLSYPKYVLKNWKRKSPARPPEENYIASM